MDETTTTQTRTARSEKAASESVAAVVVLFNPTNRDLDNVSRYIDQVDLVIAVDNTPDPDPAVHARLQMLDVKLLPMDGNKGIAAALNAGCLAAQEAGFRWVLMLDQDSTPSEGMVSRLLMCVQQHASERIALVAPVWQIAGGLPEPTSSECVEIDYAMTSGTLLRLSAFDEIQGFREDFFIDGVDIDFCFRAKIKNWRIFQRRDAVLVHRMGRLEPRRFPFRHFVTNYDAVRRYYRARNGLELRRLYGRRFPEWVHQESAEWRRDIVKIVLSESDKMSKLLHIAQGILDYRRARFGSYDELHPKVRKMPSRPNHTRQG